MTDIGEFDKTQLFNAFLVAIKRPDVFAKERENAEIWLSNTDNTADLRPYTSNLGTILYQEVLPPVVHDILQEFHDDHVTSLDEDQLEAYRDRLSPRNILAILA